MITEQWKAIPSYEGIYEVSDCGNVKRIAAWTGRNRIPRKNSTLKPIIGHYGYKRVALYRDRKLKKFFIHRLVCAAFIGEIPSGREINHKNGNGGDNRLENIEVVTKSQNHQHKLNVLGYKPPHGSKHWKSKITENDVLKIRAMRQAGATLPEICSLFSISVGTACWIANGKSWQHVTEIGQ